ncbi:LuxR C-terminal-related transcriptional regulator [Streptomyces sp. NPDC102283]|uniref:LuxR C-terminal-related transcriptional regulator n=1 Tax=Streptomyces sp. NPDC102283 TaxID=3366155 RepID=UPI0038307B0A
MLRAPLDLPFRGRDDELSRVRRVLDHASRGGCALLVVEGPPGTGKTRLLRACAQEAARLGFHVPGETRVRRQLPSLVRGRGTGPGRPGRIGRPGMRRTPVLVLVDEADHLGSDAVNALLRRGSGPHGVPTVWVVAHRSGRGCESLAAVLSTRCGLVERLTLGPLAPGVIAALAAEALGAPLSPPLRQLIEKAGGHPRLTSELLLGLQEEGAVETGSGLAHHTATRLPERLHRQVEETMAGYSRDCRQLLSVAAVLGRELDYEILAPMLRTAPSALIPLCEEACTTGAVVGDGGRTVFRNELTREILAEAVPAALRRALCREAEALRTARAAGPLVPVPAGAAAPAGRPEATAGIPLNDRQAAVVRLVRAGLTNQQIARRLDVSPHTVNYHLRRLFSSFGVRSRIDLLRAVEQRVQAVQTAPASRPGTEYARS